MPPGGSGAQVGFSFPKWEGQEEECGAEGGSVIWHSELYLVSRQESRGGKTEIGRESLSLRERMVLYTSKGHRVVKPPFLFNRRGGVVAWVGPKV